MQAGEVHGPILIVEDNVDERELMALCLTRRGHMVVSVASGEEAMSKLRRGLSPCCILLDLQMPDKDGFCFRLEQLADPQFADIPVILWSAHPEIHGVAERMGAAAFFPKGCRLSDVADGVLASCGDPEMIEELRKREPGS